MVAVLTFTAVNPLTTPLTCSETLFCSESLLLSTDGLVFQAVS